MAARRNKSQARRNQSNGLPGWAWLVLGILLTLIVVLAAPSYFKSDGDDFFRPRANPDARPVPVSTADEEIAPPARGSADTTPGDKAGSDDFAFYDLLTGKEVPMTDAELAATQRAERERQAALEREREKALRALSGQTATPDTATAALPAPVDADAATPARPAQANASATTAPPVTTVTVAPAGNAGTAAGIGDGSRYVLQAGAFKASGQAEELKAKIALLGLGARVEPAQIQGATVYRVRMGPYGTASDLADAKHKLESGGLQALAIKVQ